MKKVFLGAILACACFNLMQAESLEERKAKLQAELDSLENAQSNEAQLKELKSYRKNLLQEQKMTNQAQQTNTAKEQSKPTKRDPDEINFKAKTMKSGWIAGVEGAYVMPLKYSYSYKCDSNLSVCNDSSLTSLQESLNDPENKAYYTAWAAGILGGYQHFFSHYFGLRGTVGWGFGGHTEVKNKNFQTLSADIYAIAEYVFGSEKSSSIGLLGGVGYRYFHYGKEYSYGVGSVPSGTGGITYNFGLTFGFNYIHRIELIAKYFPIEDSVKNSSSSGRYYADIEAKTKHTNVMFVISYIKVF